MTGDAPHFSGLDDVERFLAHDGAPGLSMAVVEDGRIGPARGFGVADASTGEPVTPGTLFQAGSVSKPVAALAALVRVDLEDLEDGRPGTLVLRQFGRELRARRVRD